MQSKYDICFQSKNEQSRANVENCSTFATPLFVVQMYTFASHLLFVKILYKYVNLHYICLFSKQQVKAAITAFAPVANTVLNIKFAMKQTWSKLGKCGLYTIFASDLLPTKIYFFVQCKFPNEDINLNTRI